MLATVEAGTSAHLSYDMPCPTAVTRRTSICRARTAVSALRLGSDGQPHANVDGMAVDRGAVALLGGWSRTTPAIFG